VTGPDFPSSTPPPGGALHENFSREEEFAGPSDRRFGLTIAAVCGAIGGVRLVLGHSHWLWWMVPAAALAGLALCAPAALNFANRLWFRLGLILYRVVNPAVMALLYWSTIVPTGLLMRLCGKDPLRLRREPDLASYWIAREPPGPPADTMRNQF
jgi:Saxitoxin biosynthesis operon protein SxtJ